MTNLQRRIWNLTEELLFDDHGISTQAAQELVGIIAKVISPEAADHVVNLMGATDGRFYLDERYRAKIRQPS